MKVSCLVLTYNEATNIGACLRALSWCDDILVLDSGSSDATVEIARIHRARVMERPFDDFASQRNFGLEEGAFRHDWVLHLDADEIVTEEFVAHLAALEPRPGIDAYRVPSKMMLFGRWIKHAGMYPVYQVRLGHRDRLRFVQVGHGQREDLPAERIGIFEQPYLHFCFSRGLRGWLDKHVRYARDEATLILEIRQGIRKEEEAQDMTARRRVLKARAARLPAALRPLLRFLYIYLFRQGFRDGRAGFAYAFMLSVYEGMISVFLMEAIMGANRGLVPSTKEKPGE
jgi:glycosyltransferase involved in cell wall biosynthesis